MRYIFNTTFLVDDKIQTKWIEFMQQKHLLNLKRQQLCNDILFTRVQVNTVQDGTSFSLQLIFPTKKNLDLHLQKHQDHLINAIKKQFGQQVLYFSTLLEEI